MFHQFSSQLFISKIHVDTVLANFNLQDTLKRKRKKEKKKA